MFSHLPPRQQYALLGLGGLALIAMAGIGGHYLRQPAPIALTPLPEARPRPDTPSTPPPPSEVIVHVAGAVRNPGVVHLPPGDRVDDAIRRVGGARPDADLDGINLAAKLEDGTQIYVPRREEPSAKGPSSAPAYRGGAQAPPRYSAEALRKPSADSDGIVSLNSGTLDDLDTLPGIGPATAQKILDYRDAHGPFRSIDDLLAIPGIGVAKLERIRGRLRL